MYSNINGIIYLQQILENICKFVLLGFREIFVTGDQMFPEWIQCWIDCLQGGEEFLKTTVFETGQYKWLDEHTWRHIFLESQ